MIPATAVPSHSLNTLDRIAFYKSVREKRKQLQLNQTNGKESRTASSTENTFLTQMLQSTSATLAPTSNSSSLTIASLLRKNDYSTTSSHRSATSTLTNILPALLNSNVNDNAVNSSLNGLNLTSPTSNNNNNNNNDETPMERKCSSSLPVSPTVINNVNQRSPPTKKSHSPTSLSPPRCRSHPISGDSLETSSTSSKSIGSPLQSIHSSSVYHALTMASSCPLLHSTNPIIPSNSPNADDSTLKIVRSASVKSCASDSGVSSSSPLSDNNIVHVFRTGNHQETTNSSTNPNASRKRKSLANFYDDLNADKKFSSESSMASQFNLSTTNSNIPFNQQDAIAFSYAQYALMQTLTQQFRANYPAALLHAAAAYLPLPTTSIINENPLLSNSNSSNKSQKSFPSQSDDNNNHIRINSTSNNEQLYQPYQRETYQNLLESSQILKQQNIQKSVAIDLRKRSDDSSPQAANRSHICSSYSSSSSVSSPPPSTSPTKSNSTESNNEFVCIPKKLMPVIVGRVNDWLERNFNFAFSLSVVEQTLSNEQEKFLLLSNIWHRLVLISMIENSFEIYVTKDFQINQDSPTSTTTNDNPTENDVKQIQSLINRGKTLEIDEIGFNLIRELIICKQGKTILNRAGAADAFEKAECQAQARLTNWSSSKAKYSKIVFFICNIYQVKQDVFERLFSSPSMHQTKSIENSLKRLISGSSNETDEQHRQQ